MRGTVAKAIRRLVGIDLGFKPRRHWPKPVQRTYRLKKQRWSSIYFPSSRKEVNCWIAREALHPKNTITFSAPYRREMLFPIQPKRKGNK